MRRAQLVTALLLAGIFAAGVVTGTAVCRWDTGGGAAPQVAGTPHGPPPALPPPWRTLELTPEQMKVATAIVRKHRPEIEAIVREAFPRIHEIQKQMDDELRDVLTDEQKEKMNEFQSRPPPPMFPPPGGGPPGGGPPGGGPRGGGPPGHGGPPGY